MIDLHSHILHFLAGKKLSLNSQKSYAYDLEQFCSQLGEVLDEHSLRLYQERLTSLKPAARKRKVSAVNQFLYFLYEEGIVERFYKVKLDSLPHQERQVPQVMDWAVLYEPTPLLAGRLIALLIVELGLTPSEIALLEVTKIDKEFRVLTVAKGATVRVIELPESLLSYLEWSSEQTYLFDRGGHPYSRQWLFNQLNTYLQQIGLADMTAQKLREQFILKEKAKGVSVMALAKKLGLKTPVTLEKYYKNGH